MQWQDLLPAISYLSAGELANVRKAFDLCLSAHEGQFRKSGEPYATHPIAVANILATMGADAETLIAALLHDVVEDTSISLASLTETFGPSVGGLIDAVTKLDDQEIRAHPTLDEEIETLRKMVTTMEKDVRLMVIKLVDRLHNMRTVAFLPMERRRSFARETLDIYVKIADRLGMQEFRDELEGLCIAILEPEFFPKLRELRALNAGRGPLVVAEVEKKLRSSGIALPTSLYIAWEPKTWDHLRDRIKLGDTSGGKRSAITIALVVDQIPDCYIVLGALHQLWNYKILTFKDFINTPAENGYRGVHTTIILNNGMQVRCKIRTNDMQRYARRGITAHCFDQAERGLVHVLPWLQNIRPLSRDTENHSNDFLQSLQNDLLGKSITIYGPNGAAKQLPRNSTVLDGAFFLFGTQTLYQTAIRMNGEKVPPFTTLDHSVSLSLETGADRTVSHEWLSWVNTGFATAQIREAFNARSTEEQQAIGRSLLENAMQREEKGLLAEFKETSLVEGFRKLGFPSLEKAYAAIADGHLDATTAVAAIFQRGKKNMPIGTTTKHMCTVRFRVPTLTISAIAEPFRFLEQKYGISLGDIRMISPVGSKEARFSIRTLLDSEGQQTVIQELRTMGMEAITVAPVGAKMRPIISIGLILLLWGFDPVFAHILLSRMHVDTIELSIVRFFSLTILSFLLLVWIQIRSPIQQAPLPLRSKSLWLSAFALLTVSLSTYIALETTLPCHYTIPMTSAGVILTTIVSRRRWRILIATWIFLLSGIGLLVASSPDWSLRSIIATAVSVCAFALFSVVSERYKRQEHVDVRAAQYFFVLSLICSIALMPLIPFSSIAQVPLTTITTMVAFSMIFVGGPYYLYYYILTHHEIDFVLRYSFLLIIVTFVGQELLGDSSHIHSIILPALLVTIGAVLPLLKIHTPVVSPRK